MASIEKRIQEKKISYRVKIRIKGYPQVSETFDRITDAKAWAQEIEREVRLGKYFFSNKTENQRTMTEGIDKYIEDVLSGREHKALVDQLRYLKFWKKELGQFQVHNITAGIISESRDKLKKEMGVRKKKPRSAATINQYMATLSHLFAIMVKEWGWLEANPMQKIKKLKEPKGRKRYLSDEEREKLLQACKKSKNKFLYAITTLCLATGARKMEINGLTWANVDLDRKKLFLLETKNDESRAVHLSNHCLEILENIRNSVKDKARAEDYVFPSAIKPDKSIEIKKAFAVAMKRAGIKDFRFHDLRHSTASYLAMNGATLAEIAEVLGHKTLAMVKRYAHLSDMHTAKVVESMNNKIFRIEKAVS